MNKFKKTFLVLCVTAMVLTACGGNNNGGDTSSNTGTNNTAKSGNTSENAGDAAKEEAKQEDPMEISIMIPSFQTELPGDDSPVVKALEEYTNTDVELLFTPNSSYPDKMNITLASGQLPTIMVVDRNAPSFVNAARAGAFWEVSDYLKDYPNLSQSNEIVLNNTSIDGKIYGVYRSRTLGRMGVTLRKDWLDAVGLSEPKTIDEFYNVMKAFSEQDPDGNGKDDTYGVTISKYAGPWDIMQVWFGAPNKWRVDGDKLVPTHMTPEYTEALKFFKKLYDEKLVNQDFAVMDSAVWTDPIINGESGAFVDVADAARRINGKIEEKLGVKEDPYVEVYQAPVGPAGHRDMPTPGYQGLLAISKSTVKTEAELRRVLDFLDKLNDIEMQTLLTYGIEGTHFKFVEGGYVERLTTTEDVALNSQLTGLNQVLMFIGPEMPSLPQTKINVMINEVYKANEKIVVGDPAAPFISEVYATKGQQLDNIIADARIQYIVGQIDDAGLEAAQKLWLETGGQDYIDEMSKIYQESK
jgi:putative aldouronate transport system substrate-binding protein